MTVIRLIAILLVAVPFAADAQPANHRVGVLVSNSWEEAVFRQTLSDLGYREGSNLILDVRSAHGRLPDSRPWRPSW